MLLENYKKTFIVTKLLSQILIDVPCSVDDAAAISLAELEDSRSSIKKKVSLHLRVSTFKLTIFFSELHTNNAIFLLFFKYGLLTWYTCGMILVGPGRAPMRMFLLCGLFSYRLLVAMGGSHQASVGPNGGSLRPAGILTGWTLVRLGFIIPLPSLNPSQRQYQVA